MRLQGCWMSSPNLCLTKKIYTQLSSFYPLRNLVSRLSWEGTIDLTSSKKFYGWKQKFTYMIPLMCDLPIRPPWTIWSRTLILEKGGSLFPVPFPSFKNHIPGYYDILMSKVIYASFFSLVEFRIQYCYDW